GAGHGASQQAFSAPQAEDELVRIAREVGRVDVFVGHSMGAGLGAWAVRENGLRPRLFIALGADPGLGESGPPLMLLAGQFDEFLSSSALRARTDARVVISASSDHVFELFDSFLVHTVVEAACRAVDKTPIVAPTLWPWRVAGLALGGLGALALM